MKKLTNKELNTLSKIDKLHIIKYEEEPNDDPSYMYDLWKTCPSSPLICTSTPCCYYSDGVHYYKDGSRYDEEYNTLTITRNGQVENDLRILLNN